MKTRINQSIFFCTLVCSMAMISFNAVAGADPDEFPETIADGSGETGAFDALPAEPEIAAAESTPQDQTEFLKGIASVIIPEKSVPGLLNDRFTAYLGDEVVFLAFERNAARYDLEQARLGIGFLYSEERDTVLQVGLALDAPSDLASNIRLSVGTRAYAALLSAENNDAFAVALGAEAAYQLPIQRLPLEFGISLYYAPDVLTFGQGDRLIDANIDITLPFRPQLSIFTGLRFLQVDTRPGDREIDNTVHVGIRWDLD